MRLLNCLAFLVVLLTGVDALADDVWFQSDQRHEISDSRAHPIASRLGDWTKTLLGPPSIKPGAAREMLVRGNIVDCNVDLKVGFEADSQPV